MLAPLPTLPPRRLVYLGTPEMAVPPLEALVAAGFDVVLVVTRADKKRGRGGALSPSPVKEAALRLGLAVSHRVDDVLTVGADLGVVVAFGQIIRPHVLAEVPMVNAHFSLLPRWRGAAPVERALLAGDTVTGVCIMQLEEGLDTGGVLDVVEVAIDPRETAHELRAELVALGAARLVHVLSGPLPAAVPQEGEPVYAAKVAAHELQIDWSRPAQEIDRLVRLGGAWTTFRGKRLKIATAHPVDGEGPAGAMTARLTIPCGTGALQIDRVQPEGKPVMDALAWANGAHPRAGEPFGGALVNAGCGAGGRRGGPGRRLASSGVMDAAAPPNFTRPRAAEPFGGRP